MNPPEEYASLQVQKEDSRHWHFLCPFHDDHNPSMVVNKPGRWFGHFRCWACGKNGSPQKFAKLMGAKPTKIRLPKSQKHIKPSGDKARPKPDFAKLSNEYKKNCDPAKFGELERILGLTNCIKPFLAFCIGYGRAYHHKTKAQEWAYSFPMFDQNWTVTGIRFRFSDGDKTSETGSVTGLFLSKQRYDPERLVLLCEGATDCLAASLLGIQAIGRPNNKARKDLILAFAKKYGFRLMVIVGDNDSVGKEGAKQIAEELAFAGFKVKVIFPPEPYKDLLEWVVAGEAKHEDVLRLVDNTELERPVRMQIKKRRGCIQMIIIEQPDYSVA